MAISGGCYCLRRVKRFIRGHACLEDCLFGGARFFLSRNMYPASESCIKGLNMRGRGFIRVGAVGIRIRKTSLRFPNSWAGGKTSPLRTILGRRKKFSALFLTRIKLNRIFGQIITRFRFPVELGLALSWRMCLLRRLTNGFWGLCGTICAVYGQAAEFAALFVPPPLHG